MGKLLGNIFTNFMSVYNPKNRKLLSVKNRKLLSVSGRYLASGLNNYINALRTGKEKRNEVFGTMVYMVML